ncbi:MAG: Kelch repeat-containing protein, partial [Pirellulales bacterium]
GTIQVSQASTYAVTVFVADGVNTVNTSFSWSVAMPHLNVTAASLTAISGQPVTLTVSAYDSSNHFLAGYSCALDFSSTDPDPQTSLPSSNSPLSGGTGAFAVTLQTPGSQTITVTNPHDGSSGSITLTVVDAIAVTAFDLSGNPISQAAVDQPFNLRFSAVHDGVLDASFQEYVFVYGYGDVYLSGGSGSLSNISFHTAGGQSLTYYNFVSGQTGFFTITIEPPPPLVGTGIDVQGTTNLPFTGKVASFTDSYPGAQASDLTASIAWGNGATSTGTVTSDGKGGFDVTGTQTYAVAGAYPIAVTVSDNLGNVLAITASGIWAAAAPMPQARYLEAAVTGADGRIYTLGGYDQSFNLASVVMGYDPASDAWTTPTSLPATTSDFAVAAGKDGRIYVLGGYDSSGNVSAQAEAYDPATNAWTALPAMLTPLIDAAAATGADGRIYVLGGFDSNFHVTAGVEVYDPSLNTWSTAADLATPRDQHSAVTGADGRIYLLGGYGQNGIQLSSVDVYDPSSNTSTTVTNLPAPAYDFAVAPGSDGRIFVLGGYDANNQTSAQVEAYDPASGAWTTLAPMST